MPMSVPLILSIIILIIPSEFQVSTRHCSLRPVARLYGRLLHSNEPPSPSDYADISEIIHTHPVAKNSKRLWNPVKAHLEWLTEAYRPILSHLRNFPLELLMEIFKHTTKDFFPFSTCHRTHSF
ncbi:hypothetical protein F5146DRAFT_758258 [Armillaria mellea]|nr:hypothetical protein F5146DRAFT_758258 [Armillaria mellea]